MAKQNYKTNKTDGTDIFPSKSANSKEGASNLPYIKGMRNKAISNNCNVPWNMASGDPVQIIPGGNGFGSFAVPGIMTFSTVFGPGHSYGSFSPVNIAARNIKTFVDAANSRIDNEAEAADYMLYIMNMANVYALYMHLFRAYGVARNFRFYNRYTPGMLLTAMGLNPRSIQSNLPRFRNIMDVFVDAIGTFPLPGNIDTVDKIMELFSKVYMDSDSPKAQIYMNVPAGFYVYQQIDTSGMHPGGKLLYVPWRKLYAFAVGAPDDPNMYHDEYNIDEIEIILNYYITLVTQSQDLKYIGANIQKAYGNNLWKMDKLSINDHIDFTTKEKAYDYLMMVHNAVIVNPPVERSCDIYQELTPADEPRALFGAKLVWRPYTSDTRANDSGFRALISGNQILDTWIHDPTPEDVAIMTAAKPALWNEDSNMAHVYIHSGCFFYIAARTWSFDYATEPGSTLVSVDTFNSWHKGLTAPVITTLSEITAFDWHPFITIYTINSDGALVTVRPVGDFDNFTIISNEQLANIQRMSNYGMWAVPEEAFYNA